MDLFNPKTGEVEVGLDPSLLHQKIQEGYLIPSHKGPVEGQRIVKMLQEGKPIDVPLNEVEGFLTKNKSARLRTAADDFLNTGAIIDIEGSKDAAPWMEAAGVLAPAMLVPNLLLQPLGSQIAAGVGKLSGVTAGISDAAIAAVAPDFMRAVNEVHGSSKGVGELAGIGASIAASGGLSAGEMLAGKGVLASAKGALKTVDLARKGAAPVAKAAAATTKAAPKIVGMLPGPRLAQLSNKAGVKIIEELAKRTKGKKAFTTLAMQIGGRAGGLGVVGAAEGAAYGLTQAMEEKFLGDPREMGEILASNVTSSAVMSGFFGAGAGAVGGALAGTMGKVLQKNVAKLEEAVHAGEITKIAEDAVVADLRAQVGLSAKAAREIQNKADVLPTMFADDLLPDGNVFERILPDGTRQLVSKAQFHKRMGDAVNDAKGVISANRQTMQNLANQRRTPAELKKMISEIEEAREAFKKAPDVQLKKIAQAEWARAKNQFWTVLDESPWVSGRDIADSLDDRLAGLALGDVSEAARKTILKYRKNYFEKLKYLSWDEAQKQRTALQEAFDAANSAGSDTAKIANEADSAAGLRHVWRAIDDAMSAKTSRYLDVNTIKRLDRAKKVYHNLARLNRHLKNNLNPKAAPAEVKELLDQSARVFGWKGSTAVAQGAKAMGGMMGAMSGASAGAGMGAALGPAGAAAGGVGGAVVGTVAGVGGAMMARKMLTPKPFTFATVGRRVATNKALLDHAKNLTQQVDNAVASFMGGAKAKTALAPIIGGQVVAKLGGHMETRKRRRFHESKRKAAAKLQSRITHLMNNPEQLGRFMQVTAGELQNLHPEMGASYAQATMRQLQGIQAAFTHMPQSHIGSLQPGLEAQFEHATERDLERLGLNLAAVTDPARTLQEVLAGTATPEQISILRSVHPVVFGTAVNALQLQLAQSKQELTPHQRLVLMQMGLLDNRLPPGFIQRSQASYEANRQGMQQPGQGMEPGNNAMGDLTKTGDIYGTRDTARHREDSAAV